MNIEAVVQQINHLGTTNHYYRDHAQRLYYTFIKIMEYDLDCANIIDLGGGKDVASLFSAFSETGNYNFTSTDLRQELPLATDFFSGALCCEVLEHLSDNDFFDQATFTGLFHCLAEAYRILQPQGKIIFTTPNICGYSAMRSMFFYQHPHNYVSHYREYTLDELVSALNYVGFQILYANAEFVWMDAKSIDAFNQIMDLCNCGKDFRGDDLFIVCQKPAPGRGKLPSPQEAGKIISRQLREYQGPVVTM